MSASAITSVFNDGVFAEQFERYRLDPASVDESWRQYFRIAEQLFAGTAAPPTDEATAPAATGAPAAPDMEMLRKVAAAASMQQAIRNFGHLAVQLDPLGTPAPGAAELTPEYYGVTEDDLRSIPAAASARSKTCPAGPTKGWPARSS